MTVYGGGCKEAAELLEVIQDCCVSCHTDQEYKDETGEGTGLAEVDYADAWYMVCCALRGLMT